MNAPPDVVVLLDDAGTVVGSMNKLDAHRQPTRHLAFSVVLFDGDGRLLLHQRADAKYLFAGRWSNTCCSHPRPGESLRAAGRRRTREELGLDPGRLAVHGAFWYRAADAASGFAEHEYDVVLTGHVDGAVPDPAPAEVDAVRWVRADDLRTEMAAAPDAFTPWLPQVLDIATGPAAPIAVDVPH
jgi:isopentenyl-diphosphate delta-isomerase